MGADYKKTDKAAIICQTEIAGIVPNITQYMGPNAIGGLEANVSFPVPFDGIIEAMFAHTSLAPGAGETFDYTLMLNGIAQGQACQIAGAVQQDNNDEANPILVVEGDLISIRVVTSLNAAVAVHSIALRTQGH